MFSARLVLAALLAPWTVPIVLVVAETTRARAWPFHYESGWILSTAIVAGHVGFWIIGLPLVKLLRRLGRLNLLILTLCGALAGAAVFVLFGVFLALALGSLLYSSVNSLMLVWGGILGASVAASFGSIAGVPLFKQTDPEHSA